MVVKAIILLGLVLPPWEGGEGGGRDGVKRGAQKGIRVVVVTRSMSGDARGYVTGGGSSICMWWSEVEVEEISVCLSCVMLLRLLCGACTL